MTELEQKFYKVFEIPPATVQEYGATYFWDTIEIDGKRYTPIDDRKLLEMICIYNEFQNNCDNFFVPININNLKENFLAVVIQVIKDETANRYFCNDVGKFKQQIQQLFREKGIVDNNV